MGLWAVSATVLLALVSAPSACAAESDANDVHLTKAAVSDSQRFVFLAGLEGCGHHYWASAFKNFFMDLDDVRHVPWSGTSSRSAAWTRCASFGSGALDESATTCLQHIVGDNSTLFVKGHEYSNSLVSSYAASLRLFSGRPSHTRLLDETAAAEAAASMRASASHGQQRDRIGRGEVAKRSSTHYLPHGVIHRHVPTLRTANRGYGSRGGGDGGLSDDLGKENATTALSLVGDMMQSYPYGTLANSTHFLPFVDVDAWAAEEAGADYRILVLRRLPKDMISSNVCHSHYHRNKCVASHAAPQVATPTRRLAVCHCLRCWCHCGSRRYSHSINKHAKYPGLGYWGGDDPAAVDFYIDVLLYVYRALEAQLQFLDSSFMMVRSPASLHVIGFAKLLLRTPTSLNELFVGRSLLTTKTSKIPKRAPSTNSSHF